MKWPLWSSREKSLISSRSLLMQAVRFWWQHKLALSLTLAIVAVPLAVLGVLFGASEDQLFSAYAALATIIMNLALIFAIITLRKHSSVTLQQAYYEGTSRFVQFFLVTFVLALSALPLGIGTSIYLVAMGSGLLITVFEKLLLGGLWLVLTLVSTMLLARWLFAIFEVVAVGTYPISALSKSFESTRGKTWRVMGRLLVAGMAAAILLVLPAMVLAIFGADETRWVQALLQLYGVLVVLPLVNIYACLLHEELQ